MNLNTEYHIPYLASNSYIYGTAPLVIPIQRPSDTRDESESTYIEAIKNPIPCYKEGPSSEERYSAEDLPTFNTKPYDHYENIPKELTQPIYNENAYDRSPKSLYKEEKPYPERSLHVTYLQPESISYENCTKSTPCPEFNKKHISTLQHSFQSSPYLDKSYEDSYKPYDIPYEKSYNSIEKSLDMKSPSSFLSKFGAEATGCTFLSKPYKVNHDTYYETKSLNDRNYSRQIEELEKDERSYERYLVVDRNYKRPADDTLKEENLYENSLDVERSSSMPYACRIREEGTVEKKYERPIEDRVKGVASYESSVLTEKNYSKPIVEATGSIYNSSKKFRDREFLEDIVDNYRDWGAKENNYESSTLNNSEKCSRNSDLLYKEERFLTREKRRYKENSREQSDKYLKPTRDIWVEQAKNTKQFVSKKPKLDDLKIEKGNRSLSHNSSSKSNLKLYSTKSKTKSKDSRSASSSKERVLREKESYVNMMMKVIKKHSKNCPSLRRDLSAIKMNKNNNIF